MEKKMYYVVDNGDTPITVDLDGMKELIEAEASDYNEDRNKEDEPRWDVTLVWLTEDEFSNLPEAH